jgi:carboxyl-terminal processing protease
MNQGKSIFAFLIMFLALTPAVVSQAKASGPEWQLENVEPFKIGPGRSFSASPGSAAKPLPKPKAKYDAVVNDVTEALSLINRNYAGKIKPGKVIGSSITAMLHTLDPHSSYYYPNEFKELLDEQQSEYSGTGSSIATYENNGISSTYVMSTVPGSPAGRAGLWFGDRIIAINGVDVTGLTSFELRELMRGRRGVSLRLTVERADSLVQKTVELRRDAIHQPSVPYGFMLEDGVGYIDLTVGFSNSTAKELESALLRLRAKGMRSLILDLRGNPGGIVDQAIKVAERFLPAGRSILTQSGRWKAEDRSFRSQNADPETVPLVLLVDRFTASSAEIVAGALQDNDRALIVGERTFGKGLVQNVIPLDNGSGLTLTTARYYTPSGRSIQRDYSDGSLYEYFNHTNHAALIGRSAFIGRTVTDRPVYGGDGIAPDEALDSNPMSAEQNDLLDPIFFFVRDCVNGRLPRVCDRDELRHSSIFTEDLVTDGLRNELLRSYMAKSGRRKLSGRSSAENGAFVRSSLRYMLTLALFGSADAARSRISDDPQIALAVKVLPRAATLSNEANNTRTTVRKK